MISLKMVSGPSWMNPYFSKNLILALFLLRILAIIFLKLRSDDLTKSNNKYIFDFHMELLYLMMRSKTSLAIPLPRYLESDIKNIKTFF